MTDTATVETLTAEVRVLMVGNRQVTLSVYRQLDKVDLMEIEPFGRVNDSKQKGTWVVGKDPQGQLSRAYVHPTEKLSWEIGDGSGKGIYATVNVHFRYSRIHTGVPVGDDIVRFSYDPPADDDPYATPWKRYGVRHEGSPLVVDYSVNEQAAREVAPFVAEKWCAHRDANFAALRLPLIVLAGLR